MTAADYLIVQSTDLLPDSAATLEHGVAVALATGGSLVSLHVNQGKADGPYPSVEKVLAKWSKEGTELSHDVVTAATERSAKKGLLRSLHDLVPDLLIVGTRQQQEGAPKAGRQSTAEVAALDAQVPTLVIHLGQENLVQDDGSLRIRRVLLPVGDGAEARDAIRGLTTLLERLKIDDVDVFLFRVGDDEIFDYLTIPERKGWRFHRERRKGYVADGIADAVKEKEIDLVAMSTRGQDGVIDVFSGTHTQKVIRRVACPVFVVPVRAE